MIVSKLVSLTSLIKFFPSLGQLDTLKLDLCPFFKCTVLYLKMVHLFTDIHPVKDSVTCCYIKQFSALFISLCVLMSLCLRPMWLSLKEMIREADQETICPDSMFLHLMCEFNLWEGLSHKLVLCMLHCVCLCVCVSIPRKVSLSLSSIAGPKLSIRSKSEKVPLAQ